MCWTRINVNWEVVVMIAWVLPPLSNSWIIVIIWLYVALNRTPNVDCYWGGSTQIIAFIIHTPRGEFVQPPQSIYALSIYLSAHIYNII